MMMARVIVSGLLLQSSTRDETHKTRTRIGPHLVMHKIICKGLGTRDETHKTWTRIGPHLVMHKIICTGLGGSVTLTLE